MLVFLIGSLLIYIDNDIEEAIIYFKENFSGTPITMSYVGDSYEDDFIIYAQKYDADEAIIVSSAFMTDESE
ncbi:MAG: hypothetical protein LUH02_02115 [Erysipelotrichaceae bacterium]|nr:hypothetical protein [Erysipelotrichaceae bacterium]